MIKKYSKDFLIIIMFVIAGTLITWFLGCIDNSYDMANYKYYSVWALFNNRIGYDIMPCGIQSYFNPLIDFPLYFFIKYFNNHPYFISFLQSITWGITVFFVYKISNLLFQGKHKIFYIIASVLVGASSVLSVHEVGMSYNDVTACMPILCSLYLFFKYFRTPTCRKRNCILFFSSLLFGLSTGLKFSGFILFISFIAAVFCLYKTTTEPKKTVLISFFGFVFGFGLTGLWWYILIYNKFGNPFFPLMNNIFHSEYGLPISHADYRHIPSDIFEFLFYPFYWIRFPQYVHVFEHYNIDFRPVFVYISNILTYIYIYKIKQIKTQERKLGIDTDILLFLNIFLIVAYVIWINNSAILRYIIIFEFLSGIYIFGFISLVFKNISIKKFFSVLIILFLIFTTKYTSPCETRINSDLKYINAPNLIFPDNSVICFIGGFPFLKFAPFYNPNVRYIQLYGEMNDYNFIYPQKYVDKINKIIKKAGKNVFLVYSDFEPAYVGYEYISKFINIDEFNCSKIHNVYSIDYYLCKFKDLK